MQTTQSERPIGGLPIRIEGGFLVCRGEECEFENVKFPIPVHYIQCAEVCDFYGKLAITIKPRYAGKKGGNQRYLVFRAPISNLYHDRESQAIAKAKENGDNDYAKYLDLTCSDSVASAQDAFCEDCDRLIKDLEKKPKADAPEFFVDNCRKMTPPIWFDDDLYIIKRGKIVGNMDDAAAAWTDRRQILSIVMHDGRKIRAKSPISRYLDMQDAGKPCSLPPTIEHESFSWIADTAKEIVLCHLRHHRIDVVRRRNDEWRSERAFEAEQFKLINQKESEHGK